MKHARFMLILSLSLALGSCAMFVPLSAQSENIQRGMTQEEVERVMQSKPIFKGFTEDGLDEWVYQETVGTSWSAKTTTRVTIRFRDGRVVSKQGQRTVLPPPPEKKD